MSPRTAVTARVPAKINLQLAVGPPRRDGYHHLATVFHAVSLYDEVSAAPADELSVTAEGEHAAGVPVDASNLALRAAALLAESAGVAARAHLHLRKNIPVAAGLAGGSADGAAALVACDALWGTALPRTALHALAARLGSDVPFALMGGTAVGLGRGDRLTPALARGRFWWVLAIAAGSLSTRAVYAECDRLRAGQRVPAPRVSDALMSALRAGDARALGRALRNDLQPAACSLAPDLARTLAAGEDLGAIGSLVCGSGPTCAFLARDEAHALDIAVGLSSSGACRTVARVEGPVPGARLVATPGAQS